MSAYPIPDTSTPQARLAAYEADPNLRHTAARWRAHEQVFPGRGALAVIGNYERREPAQRQEVDIAVQEFTGKAPDDPATAYLTWVLEQFDWRPDQLPGT